MAGGKEALAEVTGDDLFRVADGSEVDAGVPAKEYIDVRRYILEVFRRKFLVVGGANNCRLTGRLARFGMTRDLGSSGAEEWLQQFGDAARVHSIVDCRLAGQL